MPPHWRRLKIQSYTKDRIPDVLDFERRLRKEEDFWRWEIDQAYVSAVESSFDDKSFDDAISLLAYPQTASQWVPISETEVTFSVPIIESKT